MNHPETAAPPIGWLSSTTAVHHSAVPLTQNPQPLSTTDSAEDEETSDEAVTPERPALTPEDAFEATRAGDLETLKQAFEAGVVTTASKNAMGHSLFFVATTYRRDAVFRFLGEMKRREASAAATQNDDLLDEALHIVRAGNVQGLDALVERGLDVNAKLPNGESLLGTAVLLDHPGTARSLLTYGADLNQKNADGDSPLDLANYIKRPSILRVFDEHMSKPAAGSTASEHVSQTPEPEPVPETETETKTEPTPPGEPEPVAVTEPAPAPAPVLRQMTQKERAFAFTCVRWNMVKEMTKLIGEGVDLNFRNPASETLLTLAAGTAGPKMIWLLMSHGADPLIRNGKGQNAFDVAGDLARHAVLEVLIDLYSKHRAAKHAGDPSQEISAGSGQADRQDILDRLDQCIRERDLAGLIEIFSTGASPNTEVRGYTLLQLAALANAPRLVAFFRLCGTNPSGLATFIEAGQSSGREQLIDAAMFPDRDADAHEAHWKLRRHPSGLSKDFLLKPASNDALVEAAQGCLQWGNSADLQSVLNKGLNPNARNAWGVSMLNIAVRQSTAPCVKCLLKAGADPHLPDATGLTARHIERTFRRRMPIDAAPRLQTPDPSAGSSRPENASTPGSLRSSSTTVEEAFSAVRSGSATTLRTHLQNGLDPNTTDHAGQTLIICAVIRDELECVKALLEAGADPDIKGPAGLSARELAEAYLRTSHLEAINVVRPNSEDGKSPAGTISSESAALPGEPSAAPATPAPADGPDENDDDEDAAWDDFELVSLSPDAGAGFEKVSVPQSAHSAPEPVTENEDGFTASVRLDADETGSTEAAPDDESRSSEDAASRWLVDGWSTKSEDEWCSVLAELPVPMRDLLPFIKLQQTRSPDPELVRLHDEAWRMLKLYCDDLIDNPRKTS